MSEKIEELYQNLESILVQQENSINPVITDHLKFRLAVLQVHALIVIADVLSQINKRERENAWRASRGG